MDAGREWSYAASIHRDDGLDHPGLRLGPAREQPDHLAEARLMGDPRAGIDAALLDQADDAREVARQGVAAGADVELAAVERRGVRHGYLGLGDADVDQAALEGAVVDRLGHRL